MSASHIELDATGQSLGRLATQIATALRGKDKATFEPNINPQVKVVITNLDKIVFKGTKAQSTMYHRHSGFPGGVHSLTLEKKWAKQPKEVLRLAVRGMLPENRMRDKLLGNIIVK